MICRDDLMSLEEVENILGEPEIDPLLLISESYLHRIESGIQIQSKSVDNYLRVFLFNAYILRGQVAQMEESTVNPGGFIVTTADS